VATLQSNVTRKGERLKGGEKGAWIAENLTAREGEGSIDSKGNERPGTPKKTEGGQKNGAANKRDKAKKFRKPPCRTLGQNKRSGRKDTNRGGREVIRTKQTRERKPRETKTGAGRGDRKKTRHHHPQTILKNTGGSQDKTRTQAL